MLKSYQELIVWQKAMSLVEEIYKIGFPKEEMYGLSSQVRRAAISIPSNIAEGQQRKSRKEFTQFLRIAFGSSAELDTQIILAKKLYPGLDFTKVETILEEVGKMLNVIIRKLETKN
jgi:four helix bundle protein